MGPKLLHELVLLIANLESEIKEVLCVQRVIDTLVTDALERLQNMLDAPESRGGNYRSGIDGNAGKTKSPAADEDFSTERYDSMLADLHALGELYRVFGRRAQVFRDHEAQRALLRVLKRSTRHSNLSIQMASTMVLFVFLESVGSRSPASESDLGPQVYKALVFLLVESHADAQGRLYDGVLREFVASSLSKTLSRLPHVPVDLVVKPLAAQIDLIGVGICEYEIIDAIVRHPRLGRVSAQRLLQLLSKVAIEDPVHWRISLRCLVIIVKRFHRLLLSEIGDIINTALKNIPPYQKLDANVPVFGQRGDHRKVNRWLYLNILRTFACLGIRPITKMMTKLMETKIHGSGHDPDLVDFMRLAAAVSSPSQELNDNSWMSPEMNMVIEPVCEAWEDDLPAVEENEEESGQGGYDSSGARLNRNGGGGGGGGNANNLSTSSKAKGSRADTNGNVGQLQSKTRTHETGRRYRGGRVIKASEFRQTGTGSSRSNNAYNGNTPLTRSQRSVNMSSSPSRRRFPSVDQDIARAKERRELVVKQKQAEAGEEKAKVGQNTESLRQKFAHISKSYDKVANSLEARAEKSKNSMNRRRMVKARKLVQTAEAVCKPWEYPLRYIFKTYTGMTHGSFHQAQQQWQSRCVTGKICSRMSGFTFSANLKLCLAKFHGLMLNTIFMSFAPDSIRQT